MPPPIRAISVNKTTVSLLDYDVKEVLNVTYLRPYLAFSLWRHENISD